MTLTEFLLARIAEDDVAADYGAHAFDCNTFEVKRMPTIPGASYSLECTCGETRRRLAECEAKRGIVELHDGTHECSVYDHTGAVDNCAWVVDGDCSTLALLAEPYADHPDYQQEWKVAE